MKKNKYFNPQRFWLLLRNDMIINYRKYLLTIVGALIVGYFVIYMIMPKYALPYPFEVTRYQQLFMTCLLGLGAFVGLAFPELSNKTKARNYIMLPSSAFEKYLQQFLLRIVGGLILYFIIFWIDARLARISALNAYEGPVGGLVIEPFRFSMIWNFEKEIIERWSLFFAIFSIGVYLFAVRIFFQRLSLVKTLIALVASIYGIIGIVLLFSKLFYPEQRGYDLMIDHYSVSGHLDNFGIWVYVLCFVNWLFLLPLGYFKLKEKQI